MKRNASLAIALALAVTAAARIPASHAPESVSQVQSDRTPIHKERKTPIKPGDKQYVGGCTAYDAEKENLAPDENRASAKKVLDKFFHAEPQQETALTLLKEPGVHYAIALAPDPRHTNLSLIFDREMAVIQQAAQDEHYTYDSSWLPWSTDQATYPLLSDQQKKEDLAERREACPGMLLFRKSVVDIPATVDPAVEPYQQALVVLVVGEQPTGGLNEDQWNNAVAWLGKNAANNEVTLSPANLAATPAPGAPGVRDGQKKTHPAAQLPTPPRLLRILGPTFSGSLVSLGSDLARIYPVKGKPAGIWAIAAAKFPEARILSGSVSDCTSVRWFQGLPWEQTARTGRNAVAFGTFLENDDLQIYRFLNYLKSEGTEVNDTAIISEDETAYSDGSGPEASRCNFPYTSDHRPVRLFFPRDISALRNAYEKESIFASSVSSRGEKAVHTILQEGGEQAEDGGNPSDTIQAYSRHLTPFAQEALLYGIVSYLRAHHTRYLVLRCTNQLDFLFLTRFFHRAYPEGRIVTVGADLLFRREIDTTEFRGVFALSNFPLVPRNQHWSMLTQQEGALPRHSHHAFEASTLEGTYLAARYLFNPGKVMDEPAVSPTYLSLPLMDSLPEYADPFWMHPWSVGGVTESRAPTWLAVVGREGYWPIAVLNDNSTPTQNLEKSSEKDPTIKLVPPSTMVRLTSAAAHYDLDPDALPGHPYFNESLRSKLPLAWTVCAGLSLVLLLYQVTGILLGNTGHASGLFSNFREVTAPSQDVLIGINCVFAAMIPSALLSVGATVSWSGMFASSDQKFWVFLVFAVGGMVCMAVSLLVKRGWLALAWYLGLYGTLAGLSRWMLHVITVGKVVDPTANGVPLYYRMGHITSGVAPLLPVLFVLLGFYFWTWNAMAGNVLLCNGRPMLPRREGVAAKNGLARWYFIFIGNPVDGTGFFFDRLRKSDERMSQQMGKKIVAMASPLSPKRKVLLLPALLAVNAFFFFAKDMPLLTMEGRAFTLWLNFGLLFAFLLIAAEASRLFWTWIELRRLLSKLARLRLRRTFARLRAIEASSLWGMSGNVQRVQHLFFSHQLEAAGRLASLAGATSWPAIRDAVDCGRIFSMMSSSEAKAGSTWTRELRRPRDGALVTIRDVFSDAVAEVLNRVLIPYWSEEDTSLNLVTGCAKEEGGEDSNHPPLDLPLAKEPVICTAEEFVCFHYIAFIQNILARMRTMASSMILLFVSISLAISFYPFVPRTGVTMWMMVNLALIGSAVVYVYAGMDRDEILSYISNSRPGRLSGEFWLKTAAFLAGPVIGIIATQFPAVSDSVLGWVQPGLDAIRN